MGNRPDQTCGNCGNQFPDGLEFCPFCGNRNLYCPATGNFVFVHEVVLRGNVCPEGFPLRIRSCYTNPGPKYKLPVDTDITYEISGPPDSFYCPECQFHITGPIPTQGNVICPQCQLRMGVNVTVGPGSTSIRITYVLDRSYRVLTGND